MDLSIIIISFNTKKLLERCLDSIYTSLPGASISCEVIVVDNASTDGSVGVLKTKYPRVEKIFNKENLGFGKGNNMGIQRARGTRILLMNSDIQVLDRAIWELYEFGKAHPDAFVGGKLFNEDGSPQASCGPRMHLWNVFLMLFAKGDTLGITRYSPDTEKKVDWISGACILGMKKAFLDVGLFDEEIFMYMEEIDFLYRAKKSGYSVLFYPGARFIHTGAASSGTRKQPVANIFRGLLYFYKKHRPVWEQHVLRVVLILKATGVKIIGTLLGNRELIEIYDNALEFLKI